MEKQEIFRGLVQGLKETVDKLGTNLSRKNFTQAGRDMNVIEVHLRSIRGEIER